MGFGRTSPLLKTSLLMPGRKAAAAAPSFTKGSLARGRVLSGSPQSSIREPIQEVRCGARLTLSDRP